MKIMINGRTISDFDNHTFHSFNIEGDVNFNLELYKRIKPDLILQIDWGSTTINGRDFLNMVDCPKAYYVFDAFHDMGRMYRGYITHFDYVFCIDSWLVNELNPKKKAFFTPTSLMNVITFPKREKIYDVIFFGSVAENVYGKARLDYVNAFNKEFGDLFYFSDHLGYNTHSINEYACKMAESKVAINLGFKDHLSLRPFEAMAAKCAVVSTPLTDIVNVEGMADRLLIADSIEDMILKVKSILENKVTIDIEDNYNWVMNNHTIQHRVESIVNTLKYEIPIYT